MPAAFAIALFLFGVGILAEVSWEVVEKVTGQPEIKTIPESLGLDRALQSTVENAQQAAGNALAEAAESARRAASDALAQAVEPVGGACGGEFEVVG